MVSDILAAKISEKTERKAIKSHKNHVCHSVAAEQNITVNQDPRRGSNYYRTIC
jgi:hypothetical protein